MSSCFIFSVLKLILIDILKLQGPYSHSWGFHLQIWIWGGDIQLIARVELQLLYNLKLPILKKIFFQLLIKKWGMTQNISFFTKIWKYIEHWGRWDFIHYFIQVFIWIISTLPLSLNLSIISTEKSYSVSDLVSLSYNLLCTFPYHITIICFHTNWLFHSFICIPISGTVPIFVHCSTACFLYTRKHMGDAHFFKK